MRIVPFPQPEGPPEEQTLAEIEAALRGEGIGPSAEGWRELRADVRALAPAISEGFALTLRESIEAHGDGSPPNNRRRGVDLARVRAWLAVGHRRPVLGGLGVSVLAAVVAIAILGPWSAKPGELLQPHSAVRNFERAESAPSSAAAGATSSPARAVNGSAAAESAAPSASSGSPRVQQRAATLTLAPKPAEVQSVSDEVAQLAVREGGFVQSSQVREQRGAGAGAELRLSLPSARLSAALASLARLAPTRAESQSLQDITDEYASARGELADAVAERQALLRALGRASTQGEIESLHARIALAAAAVTRDRNAFDAVSRRGNNSTVEVTVLGDAHAAQATRSTLGQGLHDALGVLKVTLAVLLVGLAVLVPLALLAALLLLGWRASRRRLRERALS